MARTDPAGRTLAPPRTVWGTVMGEVIRFPDEGGYTRVGKYVDGKTEPATVIILPVVRIDRNPDGSDDAEPKAGASRRRRRRATR